MNNKIIALAFLIVIQLGGCALTSEKVDIKYVPRANITVVDGAQNISVQVKSEDKRTVYKDRVGVKKNGYGMEMAAIIPVADVAVTFANAVSSELESLGFKISDEGKVLKVQLIRFYNDFKMGFFAGDAVADGLVNVAVETKKGILIFTRSYEGGAIEKNIQLATGDNARLALTKAMTDIVTKISQDKDLQDALMKSD